MNVLSDEKKIINMLKSLFVFEILRNASGGIFLLFQTI